MSRENTYLVASPTAVLMFQSAPGSMSRENESAGARSAYRSLFQSAPGSMSRENVGPAALGKPPHGFNPLPAR